MSDISTLSATSRLRRPLLTLVQGLFTLALTLIGLLLITFALSALFPCRSCIANRWRSRKPGHLRSGAPPAWSG